MMTECMLFLVAVLVSICSLPCQATVHQLTEANHKSVLAASEFCFVNFYADWCHFSQQLSPIIDEVGTKIKQEFPDDAKLTMAKVDCDREVNLAQTYGVSKYPTMKIFRYGEMQKREYRGQRSVQAIIDFIKNQLTDQFTVVEAKPEDSVDSVALSVPENQGTIIGFYPDRSSAGFLQFAKISSILRDDCKFIVVLGIQNQNSLFFQKGPNLSTRQQLTNLQDDSLKKDIISHCVPLVRTITFQNAEELTEEGLPFFLLFHRPDDTQVVTEFETMVQKHLSHERKLVNFLVGDGNIFSHPLHHLGKTSNDLPIVAIDSFKHMYLFPHDVRESMHSHPDRFQTFINDLQSGKLHREFHYGPDPTTVTKPKEEYPPSIETGHVPRSPESQKPSGDGSTSPPESMFQKLAPSRTRYTILRDEL